VAQDSSRASCQGRCEPCRKDFQGLAGAKPFGDFDAHAYRTEDCAGVKDFASGCMRTYLILKEKASRWNADSTCCSAFARGLFQALNVLCGNWAVATPRASDERKWVSNTTEVQMNSRPTPKHSNTCPFC
jgi:hypothetical protein